MPLRGDHRLRRGWARAARLRGAVPARSADAEQFAAAEAGIRRRGGQCAESGYGTLTLGLDAGINPGNGDAVVVADLKDREACLAYRDDERHRAMIAECITPIVGARAAVQHEL